MMLVKFNQQRVGWAILLQFGICLVLVCSTNHLLTSLTQYGLSVFPSEAANSYSLVQCKMILLFTIALAAPSSLCLTLAIGHQPTLLISTIFITLGLGLPVMMEASTPWTRTMVFLCFYGVGLSMMFQSSTMAIKQLTFLGLHLVVALMCFIIVTFTQPVLTALSLLSSEEHMFWLLAAISFIVCIYPSLDFMLDSVFGADITTVLQEKDESEYKPVASGEGKVEKGLNNSISSSDSLLVVHVEKDAGIPHCKTKAYIQNRKTSSLDVKWRAAVYLWWALGVNIIIQLMDLNITENGNTPPNFDRPLHDFQADGKQIYRYSRLVGPSVTCILSLLVACKEFKDSKVITGRFLNCILGISAIMLVLRPTQTCILHHYILFTISYFIQIYCQLDFPKEGFSNHHCSKQRNKESQICLTKNSCSSVSSKSSMTNMCDLINFVCVEVICALGALVITHFVTGLISLSAFYLPPFINCFCNDMFLVLLATVGVFLYVQTVIFNLICRKQCKTYNTEPFTA